MGEEDEREEEQKKGVAAKEAKELDFVTDHHDDSEATSKVDTTAAIKALQEQQAKEQTAKNERAAQLAAVAVKEEDVDLIVKELEIDKAKAKRCLQEHDGDIVRALEALTTAFPDLEGSLVDTRA